jgi:arabinan endo-1,5-alpha-L-arabinosidase
MKTFTKGNSMLKCNIWACLFVVLFSSTTFLNAQPPSHDPSSMIQNTDGRYWIFTTGTGIWCMSSSSSSFSSWQAEATPFGSGYPSWVKNYVSGFTGFFWAPDIIKVGSSYWLYYSCAGTGAPAAIGVTKATNLKGPWTDQGCVVHGNNAIDPSLMIDGSSIWMAWGNWQSGIDACRINTTTGLKLNSSTYHLLSGQVEGPCIMKNGSYYYLFFQRGLCCQGVNSTYYVCVMRSTTMTGGFTGERVFLPNKNGRVIGPGHIGYGCGKLTYHFYDGNDNGNPKLAITTLSWSNGWPVAGSYKSAGGEDIDFETGIDLYPNPCTGNFTLNLTCLNNKGNVTVKVINLQGQTVYSKLLSGDLGKTDFNTNLLPGSYILIIESIDGIVTKKLIVQ